MVLSQMNIRKLSLCEIREALQTHSNKNSFLSFFPFCFCFILSDKDDVYFALYRFGRRWTVFAFLTLAGICGCVVGGVQVSDITEKGNLINGFSMTFKLGVATAWAMLQIFTTECYPTVVRNNAYGFHNSAARISSMVAPQIILAGMSISGLVFFLCGGLMFLSALCVVFIPDTSNKNLQDTLKEGLDDSFSSKEQGVKLQTFRKHDSQTKNMLEKYFSVFNSLHERRLNAGSDAESHHLVMLFFIILTLSYVGYVLLTSFPYLQSHYSPNTLTLQKQSTRGQPSALFLSKNQIKKSSVDTRDHT
ncbi:hypothetical protein KUTeg_012378 [Tegillarca granosa]|uniref:Major facilitator superfamily (MFS) profile domain-containing protein n=1 Tax=Tegillarca granosa TaxID=220873 RepID=A0ABQ9F4I5_TEGGR|nr:hypothetical protein KUTeg_012378 [Tegillarca granosa]